MGMVRSPIPSYYRMQYQLSRLAASALPYDALVPITETINHGSYVFNFKMEDRQKKWRISKGEAEAHSKLHSITSCRE